ncbi:alpha/beta-hydrolase [Dacryopinax primogenitus]|uniref:Alpha/beta-hydrolase n=1 Tax=Dacryopinax primogenitus (strain DJM 731) TaxID=1858805 RepID=M5G3Y5_DACPD|nr:alpha/beta-hydrolase [Dacryopinax primogenitus]EJU00557.1 alpha/beta-hydrolase [Dacryopinax primogenitus]
MLVLSALAQATYTGPPNAYCTRQTYHVSLPSFATVPFTNLTTLDPSQPLVTELQAHTGASYDISGVLCTPKDGDKHNGTIQLLVHGIAFDSSYWDLGFQPENYSYVLRAAEAGYVTFRYDRLGTGESEMPFDGYNQVQAATDLQILLQIISLLHSGGVGGQAYSTIVGVGHSYGSIQLAAASAAVPDQLSALVLTGFSANGSYVGQFQTYVISGLPQSSQINFFFYPFYDQVVASFSGVSSFTGPVHVVTGDRDWVFCGSQCDIKPDGQHTILDLIGPTVFPKSSNFSAFSPQNTGHGLNMHFSTPSSYTNILEWLTSVGF